MPYYTLLASLDKEEIEWPLMASQPCITERAMLDSLCPAWLKVACCSERAATVCYTRRCLLRNHRVTANSKATVRASVNSIQGRKGRKAFQNAHSPDAGGGDGNSVGIDGTAVLVGNDVAVGGAGVLVGTGKGVAVGGTGVSVGAGSGVAVGAAAAIASAVGDGPTGSASAASVGGAGGAAELEKVCDGMAFGSPTCFSTTICVVLVCSAAVTSNDSTGASVVGASGDC
jgi:hypothetical protein